MNKNVQQLVGGRILKPWTQPIATAANLPGVWANDMIITVSSYYTGEGGYWPFRPMNGLGTLDWITENGYPIGWYNLNFKKANGSQTMLQIKSIRLTPNIHTQAGRPAQTAIYTNSKRTKVIDSVKTFLNDGASLLWTPPPKTIITNEIFIDFQSLYGSAYTGLTKIDILADEVIG
jgi:hypothetical protein